MMWQSHQVKLKNSQTLDKQNNTKNKMFFSNGKTTGTKMSATDAQQEPYTNHQTYTFPSMLCSSLFGIPCVKMPLHCVGEFKPFKSHTQSRKVDKNREFILNTFTITPFHYVDNVTATLNLRITSLLLYTFTLATSYRPINSVDP